LLIIAVPFCYFTVSLTVAIALAVSTALAVADGRAADIRYVLINLPAKEVQSETLQKIKAFAATVEPATPRVGIGVIISYLRDPPPECLAFLQRVLALCRQHELAVIVQLDGEQWWQDRPDLWNWWDQERSGYDPKNAENVEWSGWSSADALKIAWRNWDRQWRVLPPPNLMSKEYRAACHAAMAPLLSEIIRWRDSLPEEQRWMFVGVKVGWESAIGMGSHYYPNGNALVDQDSENDPQREIQPQILPGRGFQPIGYAAVSTAGLATEGELKEEHLAEVVRRHLTDLSKVAYDAGLAREEIFTHSGGWKEGELLYRAGLNQYSCPGWSFYRHARDPSRDKTAMAALANSNARYWAAVEWLPVGARTADDWSSALYTTLSISRCRYVCIYNWAHIEASPINQEGIHRALKAPLP
jgi:hypothetical protein